jgi:hypothetical protein
MATCRGWEHVHCDWILTVLVLDVEEVKSETDLITELSGHLIMKQTDEPHEQNKIKRLELTLV